MSIKESQALLVIEKPVLDLWFLGIKRMIVTGEGLIFLFWFLFLFLGGFIGNFETYIAL